MGYRARALRVQQSLLWDSLDWAAVDLREVEVGKMGTETVEGLNTLQDRIDQLEAAHREIRRVLGLSGVGDMNETKLALLKIMAEHARATEFERYVYEHIIGLRPAGASITWEQAEATDNNPATGEGSHG